MLIEPWSGSVLQPSTSSHVSFYINKSFFSPSLPLLRFLSCTPTQSLSEAHEDGRRKEGGGWSMTREKGKALLLTLHLEPSIYCFAVFSPLSFCFQIPYVFKSILFCWNVSYCKVIRRAASLCSQNYPITQDLLSSGIEMSINLSSFMCKLRHC